MKNKTILVNLFAGPGTGKSTMMAGLFSELKYRGVNCEMAPEFAKEKVWEESLKILEDQIYIFGKQLHTIHRIHGKVDVIITDSPLLLSLIYGKNESPSFKNLVLDVHHRFDNINIFLHRKKVYNPAGRLQTEEEAKVKDQEILEMLNKNNILYINRLSDKTVIPKIIDLINLPTHDRAMAMIMEEMGRKLCEDIDKAIIDKICAQARLDECN